MSCATPAVLTQFGRRKSAPTTTSAIEPPPTTTFARVGSKPAPARSAVALAKLAGISVSTPVRIQKREVVTCRSGTAKKLRACRRSCKVAGQAASVSLKPFKVPPQAAANSRPSTSVS